MAVRNITQIIADVRRELDEIQVNPSGFAAGGSATSPCRGGHERAVSCFLYKKDLTANRGETTLSVQKAAAGIRLFLCRLYKNRRKSEYGPDE
jgi:hypothetical protein